MHEIREKYRHRLRDWPKHPETGLKTIAIVGFQPSTRHLAPYDDDNILILGLNEAYHHDFMLRSNGQYRYDAWLQIHRYSDFMRRGNESDPNHPEWMQTEHEFPIYTWEEYEDIPNAIAYPLEEILEKFIGDRLVRGNPHDDGETPIRYITSSMAYCVGLAMYYGFERIELYGFSQATGTEYQFQKGASESWIHLAVANGIQVFLPNRSALVRGRLYGKEFSMHIGRQELEKLHKHLKKKTIEQDRILHNIVGAGDELARRAAKIKEQGTRRRMSERVEQLRVEETEAVRVLSEIKAQADIIKKLIAHIDSQFGYNAIVDEKGNTVYDQESKDILESEGDLEAIDEPQE